MNVYCNIKGRLQEKKYLNFPDLFQMVQDYEREQDERNERLGKKGPRPVQCGAVYATPQERAETSEEESASNTVDLQHVLKELKNLQVKFDTQIKQNQTQNKKQNNPPKPKPKKAQTPQVQCGNQNIQSGTQGAQASPQGPAGQQSSWKPRTDDQPRVFRGKCYNCKSLGHTMVMCPETLDMEQVRINVEEVKALIARRKAAEDAEPHHG